MCIYIADCVIICDLGCLYVLYTCTGLLLLWCIFVLQVTDLGGGSYNITARAARADDSETFAYSRTLYTIAVTAEPDPTPTPDPPSSETLLPTETSTSSPTPTTPTPPPTGI